MEVLISMFILAIGLMGVAALIPAGRHEIVEGMKLENAAMVGRSAFRDLQVRGYLNPRNWRQAPASTQVLYDPAGNLDEPFRLLNPGGGVARSHQATYCIDPLGRTAAAGSYPLSFPAVGAGGTMPPLMRVLPIKPLVNGWPESRAAFDTIFRSSFDQVTDPNTASKDLPPTQKYFPDGGGLPLRRASNGNYSWLATIVSDPTKPAADVQVTVSVAVFHKRDLSSVGAGEHSATVKGFPVPVPMLSGGEAVIEDLPVDASGNVRPLRPGQWIMLAGTMSVGPPAINHYRWYRVLSAANYDTAANEQRVTLAGHDWAIDSTPGNPVKVWIFDNIVSVYEKNMPLEIE